MEENREGMNLNGTHQFLVYAHDINIPGENINILNKYTALLGASKEVGLEASTEKT
jgi:hypothetical protein